jgi:hypothetical protein
MEFILKSLIYYCAKAFFRTLSNIWEKGPWPRSWHNPAIVTFVIVWSRFSTNRPFYDLFKYFIYFLARWAVPSECSNLVWFAPANTKYIHPNYLISLNL